MPRDVKEASVLDLLKHLSNLEVAMASQSKDQEFKRTAMAIAQRADQLIKLIAGAGIGS